MESDNLKKATEHLIIATDISAALYGIQTLSPKF